MCNTVERYTDHTHRRCPTCKFMIPVTPVPYDPVQFLLRKEKAIKEADENVWVHIPSFHDHQKTCRVIFDGLRKIKNTNRDMIASGIL